MTRSGIEADDLIFIDEINLQIMKAHGELTVTLVDHNIIPGHQAFLKDAVVEIIDHHKEEMPSSPNYSKTIEPVGSCSTLVAEKILQLAPDILDEQVTGLLLAAILVDTVNLDPRAGRKTDKDVQVVEQLKKYLKTDVSCEELYLSVSKAKFDTSTLTCMEILRKDFKAVPTNQKSHLSIGISSIGLSLQSFFTKENIAEDLSEFSKLRGLSVLVVMAMYFHSMEGPPSRQLAVYGLDKGGAEKLSQFLKDKNELELVAMESVLQGCECYDQKNVKASRKLVFPLVMEFLNS
ncbi:Protein prune-like [Exaiptasia diaphana]|nr:Protein prune-like [Exaiptasia diaphana]